MPGWLGTRLNAPPPERQAGRPALLGSITHTDDFASAAVAFTADAVSLGIDTERVLSAEQARDVGDVVASSSELQH